MKKEYDFPKIKEIENPYTGKKQAVGINLSPEVVGYFKGWRMRQDFLIRS